MVNLLNVDEMLYKKTENLPVSSVEVIDLHQVVSMSGGRKAWFSWARVTLGRERSEDSVEINGFFGEFCYKGEQRILL